MKDKNIKELWWKPAVMIFSNVSAWIAGPIILALVVGKYLDKRYDSAPWFFIGLTIIAFIVSIGAIWKILAKYIKEIEKPARPHEGSGAGGEAKGKRENNNNNDDRNSQ